MILCFPSLLGFRLKLCYAFNLCPYWKGTTPLGCGLCYDSGDDEYKVILIYTSFYAMYYVKTNKWRNKENVIRREIQNVVSSVIITLYSRYSWECKPGIRVSDAYDILFPIIIKLSVKSLLRFQFVCKLWNTIISDKEFRKIHFDQSNASSTQSSYWFKRMMVYSSLEIWKIPKL
ncbi:hypothetical protein H5410_001264 [Solanum commersonii]|uniref:F-box domain-containing protein n=1 Tax=Solanum commersonii TaxID=4109 RepID=A0A9J6AZ69_SOLCO|nr:hypothetical protein H5410_001264 [Solanum commersonii]